MKKYLILISLTVFAISIFSSLPQKVNARDNDQITDWYLKDYNSEITVNKDSSLDITESIVADCGLLPNKHGIYRVIPYQSYGNNNETFKAPISHISVKGLNGQYYNYEQTNDRSNKTISIKIGDADKTVTGINNYIIQYHVENVIRTANSSFDELYWNLNGNFWDIETDHYKATVTFPSDFNHSKGETNLYSGAYGADSARLATGSWISPNQYQAESSKTYLPGEGITLSVTYSKNYFIAYVSPFMDKYGLYLFLLIPIAILVLCYMLWYKYGKDPNVSPTIAPEFEIPEKLSPIDMGVLITDGKLRNTYLTASIVNLAVNGYVKIEQTGKKGMFSSTNYILHREKDNTDPLSMPEKELIKSLFGNDNQVKISDLKNTFYSSIPAIDSASEDYLSSKGWLVKSSKKWMAGFISVGMIILFLGFVGFNYDNRLAICIILSALIVLIFAPLMKNRPVEGAKLFRRVQGFELYMKKAEVYRQQWLEKQNIFETFLPYAILFGIAKEWNKKLTKIYGENYMSNYHPIWYYGYVGSFDFNSFGETLESMSSTMSSTLSSSPSSSGSGGGGFSGGGGGGGGGGGW